MATQNMSREERNDRNEQARSKKGGIEPSSDPSGSASEQAGRRELMRSPAELASAASGAMSRTLNHPFVLMRRMIEDMDRVFDSLGLGLPMFPSSVSTGFLGTRWSPGLDVFEREAKLIIRADLPGTSLENIQIEVGGDNTLVLQGERKSEQSEDSNEGVWRTERNHGVFRRSIRLPRGMDIDNASAHFSNGVLEISIPLPPERQTRTIAIKSGEAPGGTKSTSPVH